MTWLPADEPLQALTNMDELLGFFHGRRPGCSGPVYAGQWTETAGGLGISTGAHLAGEGPGARSLAHREKTSGLPAPATDMLNALWAGVRTAHDVFPGRANPKAGVR